MALCLDSVLRVVLGAGLNMLMMILLAYPLSKSKNRFASRDIYMKLVIFAMLLMVVSFLDTSLYPSCLLSIPSGHWFYREQSRI